MNMQPLKNKYLIGVVLLVIIGGSYYWYQKSKSASAEPEYITAAAEKGTLLVSVNGSGQVEATSQVDMKPVIAGDAIDVVRVYVKNDQAVKKGDMLVLLDSEDAQKAVRNAQLDLESAKNKQKQTKHDDASTKYDKEAQEIAVEQKENSLLDAKAKLSDYYIRAPFDGIVTGLSVEAGDSVSRSDILASVITKDVHAVVSLNEVDAVGVEVGDKVTVKFDALPDLGITGKVSKIDTIGVVTQGVVSYGSEITFDYQEKLLKPGMNVSATIITDTRQSVVMVPNSAVKSDADGYYVEILSGKTPESRTIQIGMANNASTEIVSGISEGEKVVIQTIDPNATSTVNSSGQGGLRLPGVGGGAGRAFHAD
jgi:HlyD family secretion protein